MISPREEMLRVLSGVVGPLLEADGADVYVVEITESSLRLHLAGRYSGCPGNTLAIRRFVEPALYAVAPTARILISSGALIPAGARPLTELSDSPAGS